MSHRLIICAHSVPDPSHLHVACSMRLTSVIFSPRLLPASCCLQCGGLHQFQTLPASCRLQYEACISYIQSQTLPASCRLQCGGLHQLYSVPDPSQLHVACSMRFTSVIFSPRSLPASCRLQCVGGLHQLYALPSYSYVCYNVKMMCSFV